MTLESEIAKSEAWIRECTAHLQGITVTATERVRVAVSLLHLCVEHQMALQLLVENGLVGSAFALLRPLYESYIRGVWFARCATDADINAFLDGKQPPRIDALIVAVEGLDEFEGSQLAETKRQIGVNLNDFTHGGKIQVKARNTADEIVSNFHQDDVIRLLECAASVSLLASIATAALAGRVDLPDTLLADWWNHYGST